MFVAPLPVCPLLSALYLVEGTISLMPFRPPLPVTSVFAVIPLMVVSVIAVVVPPLFFFIPLSGIFTSVVLIVVGPDPHWGNKCRTQKKGAYISVHAMHVSSRAR